jgi:hypothetical protein
MSLVLATVAAVVVVVAVWRWEYVSGVFLSDWKSVLLNGLVVVIFALGVMQLYRAFGHYAQQERALLDFEDQRRQGRTTVEILDGASDRTQLHDRYRLVKSLFERGVPIDHGAIAAIAVAEDSTRHAFPRFVNNVLILTGVFGTVSSLIFALIGASDVLRAAVPGEGLGLMLLGMNTALTTTATAIVCFFMFSYFYQRLIVVQTTLASRLERTMLIEVIPEFRFEPEVVEHQTKILLSELSQLVMEIRRGVTGAQHALTDLEARGDRDANRWQAALVGQQEQNQRLDALAAALVDIKQLLREGFRLH